jgi:3-isopropylmalate/(R)-2-methylmalate dehydratase small subunit
MKSFSIVRGVAAQLLQSDLDTDVIVRVERLVSLQPGQFGPYAFESLRYHTDGSEVTDFVLNQEPYRHAQTLLTGANFGCGSSRESAVWALTDFGVRCVIGTSFGDIFRGNCLQNGLLPLTLSESIFTELCEAHKASQNKIMHIDLVKREIALPDIGYRLLFEIDGYWRQALLEGQDQLARTLQQQAIKQFQRSYAQRYAWAGMSQPIKEIS